MNQDNQDMENDDNIEQDFTTEEISKYFGIKDLTDGAEEEIIEMTEKERKSKLQALLKVLKSGDETKIMKVISAISIYGDETIIRPMSEALLINEDEEVEKEILDLLSSIKTTKVIPEMMTILHEPAFKSIQRQLISTIWNMKPDFSEYLSEFVLIAAKGDYLVALESLTVIENMDGPFKEEQVLESQLILKSYLETTPAKDEKTLLISEIAVFVKDIDDELNEGIED